MTNVKNITDLPIAESSDGLNLIVNDGGSAKQIAASAVGAQADWNVTDEASPAFIKNKPETAQADWEIKDETNAAFIKNKPFADTREYGVASLTFDGDLSGKECIDLGVYLVKISDDIISTDDLIGGHFSTYYISDNKTDTVEITGSDLFPLSPELITISDCILIASDDTTIDGKNITHGVWFMYLDQVAYVSELSYRVVSGGELKQIDEKFIPEKAFAQADWTETDFMSPAFIKNKPMTGYMIKPTAAEITVGGTTFICTTKYDELAKALEKGISACVRIPMSVINPSAAEKIPYFVVNITSWGFLPAGISGNSSTGEIICHGAMLMNEVMDGMFIFTNGTYVPNLE